MTLFAPLVLQSGAPSAATVIQQVQKAYDSVSTFEQNVTGDIGGMKGTAHISFARPGRLRVTGDTMMSSKYDLICNGNSTWLNNGGNWSQPQNAEMGIATITGISANAGTLVPATLMHAQFGNLKVLLGSKPFSRFDTVRGKKLILLGVKAPFPYSVWIDPASHLVVRSESTVMQRTITVVYSAPKVNSPIPANRFKKPSS